MTGTVEEIYIAREGGFPMERVVEVRAVENGGLVSDRYKEGAGYWTRYGDVCEVTLIEGEDLDEIERKNGLSVKNGEHRRNIIGEAVLEYDRPRPPCTHVESLTEPGMRRALGKRGGIRARVVEGGRIRPQDEIVTL